MSKLIPFLFAGIGASSVSVGGVFMLKKTGGGGSDAGNTNGSESQQTGVQTPQKLSSNLGFKELDGFKNSHGGECAKQYFSEVTYATDPQSSSETIDSTLFSETGEVKSCLLINWERTDDSSTPKKWKGDFQWLWSLVRGNKGMVAFVSYKQSSSEEKKMNVEGGVYVLEKDNTNTNWTAKKYKVLKAGTKSINKSDFDTHFPKKGDAIGEVKEITTSKDYWGFVSGNTDVDNICKSEDTATCPATSTTGKTLKASWKWTEGSSNSVDKWGKEVPTTMSKLFTDWNFENVFNSMKGTWTIEEINSTPVAGA